MATESRIRHNSEEASEKGCDDTAEAIGEHDSVRKKAKRPIPDEIGKAGNPEP
jgi:hypothetical protein